MFVLRLMCALSFVSWLGVGARAEDDEIILETSLLVKAGGKATVTVRGDGVDEKSKPGVAVKWRTPTTEAGVLVRVDFGGNDFYETYLELGSGDYVLDVPDAKGGALVAGKRKIPLSRGIALTSYTKDKSWDLTKQESPDGMPTYGARYLAPGKRGVRIDQVVLHATLTATARESFKAHVARSLSTHLFVERDGTLIQALDLDENAYHAGENNTHSIGLDLVGELHNVARLVTPVDVSRDPGDADVLEEADGGDDDGAVFRSYADPNVGVTDPRMLLPLGPAMRINGALVQSHGYSARATRTLEALLLALWRAYPTLGRRMATDLQVMGDPMAPGIVTHWQTEAQRWDPGPGFDVARISRLAALVAKLEAR